MPTSHRFALFRNPGNPAEKPVVFPNLTALGRCVHRARQSAGMGGGLDMENQQLVLNAGDKPAPGVMIWTTDFDGNRLARVGWANLDGGGLDVLQGVLRDLEPEAARRRKAA